MDDFTNARYTKIRQRIRKSRCQINVVHIGGRGRVFGLKYKTVTVKIDGSRGWNATKIAILYGQAVVVGRNQVTLETSVTNIRITIKAL